MLTEEWQGEQIEVEEVEVKDTIQEPWNIYILMDGTKISLKNVLLKITKSVNIKGADGNPLYFTRSYPITKVN